MAAFKDRRATTALFSASLLGIALVAIGPFAIAFAIDTPGVTIPPVTTPVSIPGVTIPEATNPDVPNPTDVGGVVAGVEGQVTGVVSDPNGTVTGVVDPALATLAATVRDVLGLLGMTLSESDPTGVVGTVPGLGETPTPRIDESSRRQGGSDVAGTQGGSDSAASTAGGRNGRGGSQSSVASGPVESSIKDLASLRRAAVKAAGDFALPFMLGMLALGYLIFQARAERHEPRLTSDTSEDLLRFH